jgi:hypothetical protein
MFLQQRAQTAPHNFMIIGQQYSQLHNVTPGISRIFDKFT